MNDKSALLDSLKIERAPVRRGGPSPWLYAAIAIVLLLAAGGAWYFWPDSRISVHVVTVSSGSSSGGGGGSDLDASGYIVARRKATLSANSTRPPLRT